MQYAEDLKVAAREAQARETQIRADLEELRLMAGAEKLAAQSARAELDKLKTAMASSVEAERQTSAQARTALDEFRATLARTFGEGADLLALAKGAGDPVALDGPRLPEVIEMPPPRQIEGGSRQELDQRDHDDVDQGLDPGAIEKQDAEPPSAPGPGIAEGLADEAAASPDDDAEDGVPVGAEMAAPEDPDSAARAVIEDVGRTAEPALLPADLNGATRPPSFYAERPHEVDSLQAIDGIDPKIEELLNRNGCYQIRQIAHLTADDVDWLGRAMVDLPDLKERIERDGWIEQARELDDGNYLPNDERPRWWNRRRLQ
jgi:predicted flap endonuclease-1-like 5' DNA nuclease